VNSRSSVSLPVFVANRVNVDGVVYACGAVLELLTGDRDALERMERVLEKANDPRLEQTLEYHAAASTSPAERAKLLKRLAKLATDRQDDVRALERWEQTMHASPSDPDALAALRELYERAQRWPELAQILERLDGGRPMPPAGSPDAAVRVFDLETYAQVLDQHLKDSPRAIKAWHRVLDATPKSRTALDALARLYREGSKWRELTDILGRQAAVLVGSSGVGKSTLVNRFVGHEQMAVKEVRLDDDEGRHTTSHRELILLPGGGVVIDTPGIRELQLWDASEGGMSETFSDVEELAGECRFNDCTHTREPGCAVLAAVASGELPSDRLQSWFKLQRELRAIAIRHDHLLRKEETRKWKLIGKEGKAKARRR